jgi:hypothetical protein
MTSGHLAMAPLSNLRRRDHAGQSCGDIYGKVLASVADIPGHSRIRFISVTPEFKLWAITLSSP